MLKCNGKETSGTRSAKNYQHMQHHFPSALSAWQNWILQETGKPGHAPNTSIKATRVQNCPLKGAKHHIASFGVMLLKEHWCTVWGLTKTSKSRFKNEWCINFLQYFCFLSFIFSINGFPGVLFLSFHSLFLHHVHSVQHKCKPKPSCLSSFKFKPKWLIYSPPPFFVHFSFSESLCFSWKRLNLGLWKPLSVSEVK